MQMLAGSVDTMAVVMYLAVAGLSWFLWTLWKVLDSVLWTPLKITRWMRREGFSGPPFRLIFGNNKEADELRAKATAVPLSKVTHDFGHRTFAFYNEWSKAYGKTFYYYQGSEVRLCTLDPRAMKELTVTEIDSYHKTRFVQSLMRHMFDSRGILVAEDDEWVRQRRVVSPPFNVEEVKRMGKSVMLTSVQPLIEKLEKVVADAGGSADITLGDYLGVVTKEIIARAAFGSSFEKGREGFDSQDKLIELSNSPAARLLLLPGLRCLPTTMNRKIWRTRRKVKTTLESIIQDRRDAVKEDLHEGVPNYGTDLLGTLLNSTQVQSDNKKAETWTDEDLVGQCRDFFMAGEVTSNVTIAWTLVLLADNPQWQERVRAEVVQVFGDELPDPQQLHKLKLMGMVLNEVLRLYPVSPIIAKVVKEHGVKLMGIPVPKGLGITIPTLLVHRDVEIWGDDALEFNPERFAGGVSNACKDQFGYSPFSHGPRKCVGQAFAIQELKIIIAMLITRFSFTLSPSYRHEPVHRMVLYPKYGVQICFASL